MMLGATSSIVAMRCHRTTHYDNRSSSCPLPTPVFAACSLGHESIGTPYGSSRGMDGKYYPAALQETKRYYGNVDGSSTLNRGQAARSASSSHRGFLPRHLGSSAGGTGYLNNSSTDQRCSVSLAAIAGVRSSPREQCLHTRL